MNYTKFVYGAVVAGALAFAGAAQASNIVANGSFEADGNAGQTDDVASWHVGGDGMVTIKNDNPYDATYYVSLGGGETPHNNIWQTLDTVAGQAYQISFAYLPFSATASNILSVIWGDWAVPDTSPNPPTGATSFALNGNSGTPGTNPDATGWMIYTFTAIASSDKTVLSFYDGATGKNMATGLDAVSVSAVPLPGAALLFGSALLGAGALRKRKAANDGQAEELAA